MDREAGQQYKKSIVIAVVVVAVIASVGFVVSKNRPSTDSSELASSLGALPIEDPFVRSNETNPVVTFKTTMGDISIELYMDQTPITAGNFLELIQSGFYTGTKFHRVIDNFMIQGGDPNSKGGDAELYGRGGPGYTIEDEFVEGLSNLRGTISMANVGQPNTGGSQFFINYTNNIGLDFDKQPLTSKHPVFGQIVAGQDVADTIIKVETDARDLPLEAIVIEEIVVSPGRVAPIIVEEMEVEEVIEEETDSNEEESSEEMDETSSVGSEGLEVIYRYPNFDFGAISLFSLWSINE